jgi:flagellar M-ring protein FliF
MILAGTAAFFVFMANKVNTPDMGLLFSDLDLKDSGQIVQKLEAQSVPYQLRAQGAQILVPSDQVIKLRMQLAEAGMPHGGSVGYEIFDKNDNFGPSQFVENVNQLRALEGELARTIGSITLISTARVHLVLPQRQMFSRDRQEASASIVVKMRTAEKLSRGQVAAIQHLVASSVAGLNAGHVSVIDSDGNLLARGDGANGDTPSSTNTEEMRVNYENRMSRNVQDLLERSVGAGKARVDVHAEMNFDHITTNSESYDPDGQVVRSTQTVSQSDDSGTNAGGDAVSVSTNLPGGQTAPSSSAKQNKSARNEETVNYEITKTVKSQVREQGTVQRLSVAVLVDGATTTAADGKKTYQPRSADELKQLTALVRSAIGFDEKRGDSVEVVNMPFAGVDEPAPLPAVWNLMGFEKGELVHLGSTVGVAFLGLIILLLVVKPMLGRFIDSANAMASSQPMLAGAGGHGQAALASPDGASPMQRANAASNNEMIDIGQVDGRVAASSMKKIGEIVEKHPDEAVAIVRSWMYQGN